MIGCSVQVPCGLVTCYRCYRPPASWPRRRVSEAARLTKLELDRRAHAAWLLKTLRDQYDREDGATPDDA